MIKLSELLQSPYRDAVSIFESPLQLNRPYNPQNLESIGRNKVFTDNIIEKAKKIGRFEDYQLYEYVVGDDIFNILEQSGYTYGFFQYRVINNIVNEVGIWQSPISLGLIRRFIFDYILKVYDGLLSDDAHTELGQKYWDKVLNRALSLGYGVYVIENDKKISLSSNIDISKFYSKSSAGMNYKFLIQK